MLVIIQQFLTSNLPQIYSEKIMDIFKCSYLSVFEKSMMDIWKVCYYLQQYYYETTTVSLNICVLKTVVLFSSLPSSPKTILSPKEIDCLLSYLFKVNMFKTLFFISIKKIYMLIFFLFLTFYIAEIISMIYRKDQLHISKVQKQN